MPDNRRLPPLGLKSSAGDMQARVANMSNKSKGYTVSRETVRTLKRCERGEVQLRFENSNEKIAKTMQKIRKQILGENSNV